MGKYQVKVVKCFTLNVRKKSNATSSSTIVAVLKVNATFNSSKQENGWYYNDDKKGWVSGKYLKVIKNLSTSPKAPSKTTTAQDAKAKKEAANKAKLDAANKAKADAAKIKKVIQTGSGGVGLNTDMGYAEVKPSEADGTEFDLTSDDGAGMLPDEFYDVENLEAGVNTAGLGNATGQAPQTSPDRVVKAASMGDSYGRRSSGGSQQASTTGVKGTFENDYSAFEDIMQKIHKNHHITPANNSVNWNNWNNFNRFRIDFPDSHLSRTVGYVFFTRPALNLLTNDGKKLRGDLANDPFWTNMYDTDRSALKSLTSHWSSTHDFHNRLSNYAMSFEVPDEILKTEEHGESMIGHKMVYGVSNVESNTAGTFTVNYKEDPTYSIYNIHKIWVEYISRIHKGKILCNPKHRYLKILDYASSAYFFLCAADGETILFWSKYFGVFPTNVPSSGASWTKGAAPKTLDYGINYAYSLKEDMEATTLFEFNRLNKQVGTTGNFDYAPMYNANIMRSGKTFTGSPFIQSTGTGSSRQYFLRFRK